MTATPPPGQPATPAELPDIDAIEARADAATRAPWHATGRDDDPGDEGWWINGGGSPGSASERAVAVCPTYSRHAAQDMEFIAAARQDVPALLAEVRRLQTELADLKWAEILTEQGCAEGRHTEWYADTENLHACPWCEVEALRARADELDAAPAAHDKPFVDRIAQAIGDPGSVIGRKLGPSWGEGNDGYSPTEETVTRWATRAVLAVLARTTDPGPAAPTFALVADDGRCGCCVGAGEHPCGHECDSCDGAGRDPESPVCTLPHGADCRCPDPGPAAPTTYALPAQPDGPLWDNIGRRWDRSPEGHWESHALHLDWHELLDFVVSLSTVPPGGDPR